VAPLAACITRTMSDSRSLIESDSIGAGALALMMGAPTGGVSGAGDGSIVGSGSDLGSGFGGTRSPR
jgi:hypothetical protein